MDKEKLEAVEVLARIKDRDPDTMTDDDYDMRNGIANFLFGTVSLHDAFSTKHPEFCLTTVIWMLNYGSVRTMKGKIYTSDGIKGATLRVHPRRNNLTKCLSDAQTEPNGIYLYFEGHSNIIWLDPERLEIHRYDPQVSEDDEETEPIDGALQAFFYEILPNYTYIGNTLSSEQCIQYVRLQERGHLDCFCQEYTLLYARNRLSGMSHEEASEDLVMSREEIIEQVKDLYIYMAS